MSKFKFILALVFVLTFSISFAAWTQPSVVPPGGNTEPPINVGTITQYKRGTVGAFEFCLYKTNGTKIIPCISPGANNNSFPWVFDGATNNIENTNDGNTSNGEVYIRDSGTIFNYLFGTNDTDAEKLTVEGLVKAVGFCLGKDCVKVGAGTNDINDTNMVNNWQELINKYATGDVTIVNGTSLKGTTNRIVKFTGEKSIGDSGMIESATLIEADKKIFKATKGLIIPKYTSDANTLEEGAIWLNTSVVVP